MPASPEAAPPADGRPTVTGLGIQRGHHIAIQAPDPGGAAAFAVEHMGLSLVHVDASGRHYLAAHGLDPYSLVYTPGDGGVDHVSYVVSNLSALSAAQAALEAAGVECERIDAPALWRRQAAVRVRTLGGTAIELSPGIELAAPMSELLTAPPAVPGPLCFDHVVMRQADVDAALAFASAVLGLRESGRIVAPDGVPILAFFRGRVLFHCYGVARAGYDGLHHFQLTLKNERAVFAAYERMADDPAVDIVWGPVRHGCGQNIAFYFRDQVGNVVEYSAEEELILCDEAYEVLHWPVSNPRAADEWGSRPPDAISQ